MAGTAGEEGLRVVRDGNLLLRREGGAMSDTWDNDELYGWGDRKEYPEPRVISMVACGCKIVHTGHDYGITFCTAHAAVTVDKHKASLA